MASLESSQSPGQTKFTYLIGIGVTHSVAPAMHNEVAKNLNLPWTFKAQECASIEDGMRLFRDHSFAGGVVTMPYKISIMEHLDGLDDHAKLIGACNNVYKADDGSLRGTNTDWRGIQGCLASITPSQTGSEGRKRPGLIIGAGGAARAAVYTLNSFGCSPIYVLNRDGAEVEALIEDAKRFDGLEILHITSVLVAKDVTASKGYPYFIVGTVPDFEPKSQSELQVRAILEYIFTNSVDKGAVLDMCFKPRRTRLLKLATENDWPVVEGVDVIGYQIEEQYRLWTVPNGESPVTSQMKQKAWSVLHQAADKNSAINF